MRGEIRKCPYCGGRPTVRYFGSADMYTVRCNGAHTAPQHGVPCGFGPSMLRAIQCWNADVEAAQCEVA